MTTQEGDVDIKGAQAGVRATTRKGNLSCQLQGNATQVSELISEQGNVTVFLPKNFNGQLLISLLQNDAKKGSYLVESDFDLGKVDYGALKNPDGKILFYQLNLDRKIGNGKATVRIRAVNGNIRIRKSTT